MNGDVADVASRRAIALRRPAVPEPQRRRGDVRSRRHAVHQLGDGGSAGDPQNRAQNLGELLGKILRIDPTPNGNAPYTIPADNPFVGHERCPSGDLDVRAAQPVALLVRPRDRATSGSATSARTTGKRSTTRRSRTAAGSNWGWNAARGHARVQGRAHRPARATRSSSSRTPTATARSSAATCTAAPRSRRFAARTCSPTTAEPS